MSRIDDDYARKCAVPRKEAAVIFEQAGKCPVYEGIEKIPARNRQLSEAVHVDPPRKIKQEFTLDR